MAKKKLHKISFTMPLDVSDFYKQVAKLTNLSLAKVISVMVTVKALQIIKANNISKPRKRNKKRSSK